MQKHNDAIKRWGHSSLGKYTSHFIWRGPKGLRRVLLCERWVGDWTELQHIEPHSYGHNSVFSPFSCAAQPGAWGPSLCWDMVPIPASSLQLIWTSCRRSYIIIWHPPTSCERHNSHSIQPLDNQGLTPWYLRPDAPVIYTGAFLILTARPGRRSIYNKFSISSLDIETVLFQTIQFSISTQFWSIWPTDITPPGVITPARLDLEATAVKGYSALPKAPALLECYHQIFLVSYPRHSLSYPGHSFGRRSLTHL